MDGTQANLHPVVQVRGCGVGILRRCHEIIRGSASSVGVGRGREQKEGQCRHNQYGVTLLVMALTKR
jgi:hypothetical protein